MALPSYQDFYQQAYNLTNQAASNALPSAAALDTASARVRSRLEARQKGLERDASTRYAGTGNTGAYGRTLQNISSSTNSALASGLADLESNYLKQQQEGANILGGLGGQIGQLGTARQTADQTYGLGIREQDITKSLGEKKIAQDRYATDVSKDLGSAQNLIDLLQAFGAFGNIKTNSGAGRGDDFNSQFADIIARVLAGVR